ncbi:MAG: alpha-amylase family glycosyl hydrolase [Polyangiales bacterium]
MPSRFSALVIALVLTTGCAAAPDLDAGDASATDAPAIDSVRRDASADLVAIDQGITDAAEASTTADAAPDVAPRRTDWTAQVLYLALADRITNGDPSNDNLGVADCFAPTDPRRFHGGDLAGLRSRLDYLRDLGATALWITPVYKQVARRPSGSCGYHGYWPDFTVPDDGAIDPRLGAESDLRALIEGLHARDMRFVMDMVVNHTGPVSRVLQQQPSWFHDPATCATLGASEVYCPISATLADFAQERSDVADYLTAQSRAWVDRFELDGIRMDTAKHVLPAYFRDRWAPSMRASGRELFLIAEVFSEGSARDLQPTLATGFDSAFDFPLRRAMRDTFANGGSVDAVASRVLDTISVLGAERTRRLSIMLDNHDVPRFATDTLSSAMNNGALAVARYRLAMVALMTLPGVPQLYYGDEVGMLGAGDPDNRRDIPSWIFTADDRARAAPSPTETLPEPAQTWALTRSLAALRTSNSALAHGAYVELWRQNSGPNVLGYLRSDDAQRVVVLINNAATEAGPINVPLRNNPVISAADRAAFTDGRALDGVVTVNGAPATLTITNASLPVRLPPRSAGVYSLR